MENKDGSIERPAEDATPWAPIVQQLEKKQQAEEAEEERAERPATGEDCEAARQLLASARHAQARAMKEEEDLRRLSELDSAPKEDAGRRLPPLASWEQGRREDEERLVCMKNYAAVDAEAGSYGLIDRGVRETGIRTLVMHVPRTRRGARDKRGRLLPATNPAGLVRPGTMLRVRPTMGGPAAKLLVRYTTPARYYSPGQHVTTLCIGVDAADWQGLLHGRQPPAGSDRP